MEENDIETVNHDLEKEDVEKSLREGIISTIRRHIGGSCTRISGLLAIESNEVSYNLQIAFPSAAFPFLDLATNGSLGASGPSSRAESPASSGQAPKVSRRKAYQPKRVAPDLDGDAIRPLDPHRLQASVTEALAPSMAVFPTPTTEYVPPPPPLLPGLTASLGLLPLTANAKGQARQRSRAIRPKLPGSGPARANGVGGGGSGVKRNPNKEFTCNQCQDKFRSLNSLTEHTTAVHQCFRCTTCNAKFTQRSNLQRHSLKHLGFKPFQCAICRKEYYRKDHLVRHVEVSHPGSDPKGSIVNVLPSAECLRLEEERKMRLAAAAAAEAAALVSGAVNGEGAVDLSLSGQSGFGCSFADEERSITPLAASAASPEHSSLTLEDDDANEVGEEMIVDEGEEAEAIDTDGIGEEAPTDLSIAHHTFR